METSKVPDYKLKNRKINAHSNQKIVRSLSDADGEEWDDDNKQNKQTETLTHKPPDLKKVLTRSLTASILALFFLGLLQAGHFYCILLGVLTQTELYRELVNVRYKQAKERSMPAFRTLQWSWFFVAMFFVYGETLHGFFTDHRHLAYLTAITQHHHTIVFILYCTLFAASVLTLKKGLLKFQISQYMWSICIVCMVVFQCKFFAKNTLNGLFWFFFPMATVSMNDVSAYFCGITFGRKFIHMPFLSLSPNKTWEGFIGAAICTIIFSFFFPLLLSQYTWFICPAENLYLVPFQSPILECTPHKVFTDWYWQPIPFTTIKFYILPIQIHGLFYGLFASIVAPFGGFLASAIKRAYDKKDYDNFIPGHGGMMDRMDCQLLMMAFTAFHYYHYIRPPYPTIQKMEYLISLMSIENQKYLLEYEFQKLYRDTL